MASSNGALSIFSRKFGQGELSYFLPSRADGVNDMYLHIGFNAPSALLTRDNVLALWALLRVRHPLLQSKVQFNDYDDVHFVYSPPSSPADALKIAERSFSYVRSSKDELVSTYLNGPRTLGEDHLSHLFFSSPNALYPLLSPPEANGNGHHSQADSENEENHQPQQYDILIAATHYIGDGMALHNFANDFFALLTEHHTKKCNLYDLLALEWEARCAEGVERLTGMFPNSLEVRLPPPGGKCKQALAKGEFQNWQAKLIGGHSFPRPEGKLNSRHTIVPTVSFSPERTKKILKTCKEHGASISNAIFALCGIVWSRIDRERGDSANPQLPLMMYSALNMRPYMNPLRTVKPQDGPGFCELQDHDSYWFLSVGYFNVVLPSFLSVNYQGDNRATFWNRTQNAKTQSSRAAKSAFVVSRSHAMSQERAARSIMWAREDDEKVAGTWKAPEAKSHHTDVVDGGTRPKVPSKALIGLSLLGNLDGIYKHSLYASAGIVPHTLTTGSRQRSGAMLLFAYTFAGKLWLSLGYDENGFEKETVERFWKDLILGVGEFLEA